MSPARPEPDLPWTQPEIVTPGVAIFGTIAWVALIIVLAGIIWSIFD